MQRKKKYEYNDQLESSMDSFFWSHYLYSLDLNSLIKFSFIFNIYKPKIATRKIIFIIVGNYALICVSYIELKVKLILPSK